MNPRVLSVELNENFTLLLTLKNGEKKVFDVKSYYDKGIFNELKNPVHFRLASVMKGSVSWPNKQDFYLDTLYKEGMSVDNFFDSRGFDEKLFFLSIIKNK